MIARYPERSQTQRCRDLPSFLVRLKQGQGETLVIQRMYKLLSMPCLAIRDQKWELFKPVVYTSVENKDSSRGTREMHVPLGFFPMTMAIVSNHIGAQNS